MNSYSIDTKQGAKCIALSLLALWLTACGGGGGGDSGTGPQASNGGDAVAPTPAPEPETIPSPAPAPSPVSAPPPPPPPPAPPAAGPVAVTGMSQQAAPNGSYSVTSSSTPTVVITLPANESLQAGDKVTVTGQSAARWRLAQNAGQWVVTTSLPGNVAPGATWTERVPDAASPTLKWAGTASSASGNRIAAIANPGGIYLSVDAGASWTRSTAPSGNWTQVLMSADGTRLAAIAGGVLHTSGDSGQTWVARTGPFWQGVHVTDDGQRVVGAAMGGTLQISSDGGATFAPVAGMANRDWRTVAGSSDGTRLVAVASFYGGDPANQGVYVSTDSGATWTRRLTTGNWTFAAASADGMRMAVLDQGGHPWVSDDGGATFTQRFGYSIWSGLAVSRDGRVVAAQEPRADAYGYHGYNFISNAGGADPWDWHGGAGAMDLWWRGISLSQDGNWIVAVDNGNPTGGGGKIFTTTGNRTSGGTLGSISGGQNQMIEVTYQGNGRFTVTGQAGGPFAIR
ncbi:MAG: exo-alpha-sialidase [Ramlibacter sp.]|nr:exo-alpha-sialidase [Ramlibacter sp.]